MKKFIGFCVIVVVVIGTRGALAAELDADLEPPLVSDVQSIPAGETPTAAARATGLCCEIACTEAICSRETGCVPKLAFSVDAWFMDRQDRWEVIPFADGETGATMPDASQLSFGDQAAIASSVAWSCTENYGPELRYMWMGDATAGAKDAVPHATGWVDRWSYQSNSQTTELNIHKHFDWFGDQTGFRSVKPKEQWSGVQSRPCEPSTTTWSAQDKLSGAQIEGDDTAGNFAKSAGTDFASPENRVPFIPFDFANTSLQLTPHIALRGGYQVLWLDGVAAAGRQVPTTGSFNFVGQATAHVDSASPIINQCAKPGLEVTW